MKTKPLSLAIALVVCTSLAFGQEYAFKVLVNKGRNEVKSGADWQPVKVGASLRSPDELKVTENAYIGLIHVSGRPLELKRAGTYKVIDLSAKIGERSSVLNKYTDFILSTNTEKRNHMAATGAVHRGPSSIKMFLPPPERSYVFNDSITLHWAEDNKVSGPYRVVFTNFFSDELYSLETSENSVSVDLNNENFSRENDIQVQVISKADKKASERYIIRKLSKANSDRIRSSFAEVFAETTEQNALNQLVQAAFYEQNKLLIDAATAHQKAIKLAPGVQDYHDAYEEFLLRNALKDKGDK